DYYCQVWDSRSKYYIF
nr:immunoglobulin light chain junction region [Macaca mulatta]MOW67622.1 immunoglobulin light chain junction region [Macaca mulatta]MOW69361.1 immunoglobulin light chain junction region [Macaca mulatta]MOW69771.1 immunoglobulin light chain junction region [Macaca mulatta]MOW69773.1 immunoglobulin light chain junction region [Macaca mulatta]